MEIKGTGRSNGAGLRRAGSSSGGSGNVFQLSDAEPRRSGSATSAAPLSAVQSILTLQGLEDPTSGRSKGIMRGEHLLDMLDHVRDGLLGGGISRDALSRLAAAVGQREDFADPKLQGILDEIDLRAQVELAKLEARERRAS